MDLMDMVKGAVTKQVMGKIGGMLGTDEKKTSSAFETAAGSILGGLIKKTGSPQGAKDVFDMAQKQDVGVLDKLGDLLGGGDATDKFQKQGNGLLEGIFGGSQQTTGILGTLGNALGLKGGMVGMLMKLAAPIVMGVIAKHVKNKALDAVGLGNFLGSQKKSLGFMPASLTEGLGFGNLLGNVSGAVSGAAGAVGGAASGAAGAVGNLASGAAGSVGSAASGAVGSVGNVASGAAGAVGGAGRAAAGAAGDAGRAAAGAGGGLMKLLLPLLLIGGLIIGGIYFIPKLMSGAGDLAGKAGDMAGDVAGKAGDMAGDATGKLKGAMDGAMGGISMPEIPSIEGLSPNFSSGVQDITSGFAGLADSGEEGANALATKISGFTNSIDGMGLDKLEGTAKTTASGFIGQFIETVKRLMGGQTDGVKGILQPVVTTMIDKLNPLK